MHLACGIIVLRTRVCECDHVVCKLVTLKDLTPVPYLCLPPRVQSVPTFHNMYPGKSTLLKCLAGRLQLWNGSVKQGEGVKLGKL